MWDYLALISPELLGMALPLPELLKITLEFINHATVETLSDKVKDKLVNDFIKNWVLLDWSEGKQTGRGSFKNSSGTFGQQFVTDWSGIQAAIERDYTDRGFSNIKTTFDNRFSYRITNPKPGPKSSGTVTVNIMIFLNISASKGNVTSQRDQLLKVFSVTYQDENYRDRYYK